MLADREKFGHIGIYRVADLAQVDCVVADEIQEEYRTYFENHGIRLLDK